jgi:CheY-like chemotaxis protein
MDHLLVGSRILIIEDDSDQRDLLSFLLTSRGAEVIEANSAAEGLDILEQHSPDVVITDIGLPDVNGIDFFDRAQAEAALRGRTLPPVIALTSFIAPTVHQRIYDRGFRSLLIKPVDVNVLTETLQRALATTT